MALFGYPQAQENDAERAVRACLAIQRVLAEMNGGNRASGRPELVARIGVETGAVVVCGRSMISTPAMGTARSPSARPDSATAGRCGGNSARRAIRPSGASCWRCEGKERLSGMCGRFTQNYTWEEVHAFLRVFGAPRNLRPHYPTP